MSDTLEEYFRNNLSKSKINHNVSVVVKPEGPVTIKIAPCGSIRGKEFQIKGNKVVVSQQSGRRD